jgi:hypothetical protein
MPTLSWHEKMPFRTVGSELIDRARQPNPHSNKCTYALYETFSHRAEIDIDGTMIIGVEMVNYEAALTVFRDVFGARTIDQFLDSEEVTDHEIHLRDADDTEILLVINTETRTAGFAMYDLKPSITVVDLLHSKTVWESEPDIRLLLDFPRIAREHETPL